MKNQKHPLFDGVCTALATPFSGGGIDWDALGEMIDNQIEGGVGAICLCGTTGEAATLSDGERLRLVARGAELIDGRADYIVGIGTPSTSRSVSYARFAAAHGADALLAVTPYYNRGTQEGILTHFKTIADATELPVILYNVPARTGVNLSVKQLTRLAEHPNIRGIKEAGDSVDKLADIAATLGERLRLYTGNDAHLIPTLALGGHGVVSVLSNILPAETVEIYRLWKAGKIDEARRRQLTFLPLIRLLFAETNPAPLKCALEMMGLCRGEVRLPLSTVSQELAEKLRQRLGLAN